jgi:hypothetical protein
MDILMFQSRCRDSLASLWQEGMKLQEKRRNFQSRCRDLQPYKHFTQQKVYVLPLLHLSYHSRETKIFYGLPTLILKNVLFFDRWFETSKEEAETRKPATISIVHCKRIPDLQKSQPSFDSLLNRGKKMTDNVQLTLLDLNLYEQKIATTPNSVVQIKERARIEGEQLTLDLFHKQTAKSDSHFMKEAA